MTTIKLPKPPIPENARGYAETAVRAAKNVEKIDLDYSPESLTLVDEIIGRFHRDKLSVESIGATLFAFGCYVGEVFIKNVGGQWRKEEETTMRGFGGCFIVLELPNGKICNPVGKVFKRLEIGDGESVRYFYQVFTAPPH